MAGEKSSNKETHFGDSGVDQVEFKDLALYKFKELEVATSNFSVINKLGEGGFGPVYKVMVLSRLTSLLSTYKRINHNE